MRAILTTLALLVATVASFAQGKITIGNDANHLVVDLYTGQLINQAYGWNNLTMQLWGGTSAGSMILQTSFVGGAIGDPALADGRIKNTPFALTGVAGGAVATLQLRFLLNSDYLTPFGVTPVFTVTAGNFAPNHIAWHSAPGYSTWGDAPVFLGIWPEPSSLSLAVLGLASLLLFHHRK